MSGARLRVRAREAAISECTVPGKNLKLKTVKPFAVSTALSFHKSLHESQGTSPAKGGAGALEPTGRCV